MTISTRVAVTGLVAAMALSACGASDNPPAGTTSPEGTESTSPDDMEATISYALWDSNQVAAVEKNIADFNKTYPNVEVRINLTPWGDYWTKLQTQASTGTLPDVFWMNGPNFQYYAANGALEPIDALIDSGDFDSSKYPAGLNELYTYDGAQYGVPKDIDGLGVWYNKAILEEAGVAVPTDDWTWEDFQTAAKTVSDNLKDQGIYGVVPELGDGQNCYYNTILQAGGYVLSPDGQQSGFDDPDSIKGLQFWTDLIANGSSPTLEQLADTLPNQYFQSSKAAFLWSGTWMAGELSEAANAADIDVAPLPIGPAGRGATIHGLASVVSAQSKNLAAAQAFQAYLGSEEAQMTQGQLGGVNPAFEGTSEAYVQSVPNFNMQAMLDSAEYATPLPVSRNSAVWYQYEKDLLPDAFSGNRPVEEVAQELADRMNAALAEEG